MKYLDAYPVFIMWEQLKLNGYFFEDEAMDEMWEMSCRHYDNFLDGIYDIENSSEYDCISQYALNVKRVN